MPVVAVLATTHHPFYYKVTTVLSPNRRPPLADEWKQMSSATEGLDHFSVADFTRLAHEYPVTWTVIHGPAPAGMDCPYQENGYAVCRIPDAPGMGQGPASQ